jgi:hypothetical protein
MEVQVLPRPPIFPPRESKLVALIGGFFVSMPYYQSMTTGALIAVFITTLIGNSVLALFARKDLQMLRRQPDKKAMALNEYTYRSHYRPDDGDPR